jgi:predicted transcriptional regulator
MWSPAWTSATRAATSAQITPSPYLISGLTLKAGRWIVDQLRAAHAQREVDGKVPDILTCSSPSSPHLHSHFAACRARYQTGTIRCMAMNLRLSDEESEALRAKAEQEGRSMQEVAKTAIAQYVSDRPKRLLSAIERVRMEDQELLERLSK